MRSEQCGHDQVGRHHREWKTEMWASGRTGHGHLSDGTRGRLKVLLYIHVWPKSFPLVNFSSTGGAWCLERCDVCVRTSNGDLVLEGKRPEFQKDIFACHVLFTETRYWCSLSIGGALPRNPLEFVTWSGNPGSASIPLTTGPVPPSSATSCFAQVAGFDG